MENYDIDTQLVKFDSYEIKISEIKQQHSVAIDLQIKNKTDYSIVDNARKALKKIRCDIENDRKEIKKIITETGKKIDSTAKKFSDPIEEIENGLTAKQKTYDDEQARIKFLEVQTAKLPARMAELEAVQLEKPEAEILELSDFDFQQIIFARKSELLEIQAEEQRKIAEEQAEKERAIQAEKDRIAAEEQRKKDIAEAEAKAAEKAKERAEFEASEKIRIANEATAEAERKQKFAEAEAERKIKEAAEKAEADRKAEIERLAKEKRIAEEKAAKAPDVEKLKKYIADLRAVKVPEITDPQLKELLPRFFVAMKTAIQIIDIKNKPS